MKKYLMSILAALVVLFFAQPFSAATNVAPAGNAPSLSISVESPFVSVGYNVAVSVVTYGFSGDLQWESSNTTCAIVNDSGVITTLAEGETTITASFNEDGLDLSSSVTITVTKFVGLDPGESYFITNFATMKTLYLADASGSYYLGAGDWGNSNLNAWLFSVQNNGTAVLSYNSQAITAGTGRFIVAANTSFYKQKLTVARINSGEYAGYYTIRYGVHGYLSMHHTGMVQVSENLSASCYWSFVNSDFGSAVFEGFDYLDYDTTGNFGKFQTVFSGYGYTVSTITNPTPTQTYNAIQTNDVFLYHGHGLHSALFHYKEEDSEKVQTGVVAAHNERYTGETGVKKYINLLSENQLNSSRAVFYMACYAGKPNTKANADGTFGNLLEETFNKGAHFSMGPTQYVNSESNRIWIKQFLIALGQLPPEPVEDNEPEALTVKQNLEGAIAYANRNCDVLAHIKKTDPYTEYDDFPLNMIGDRIQYFGPNI